MIDIEDIARRSAQQILDRSVRTMSEMRKGGYPVANLEYAWIGTAQIEQIIRDVFAASMAEERAA